MKEQSVVGRELCSRPEWKVGSIAPSQHCLDKHRAKRLSPLRFQSFSEFFGNARPVEVEIGSGRGNYLAARAALHPDINFLGVEWKTKLVHLAEKRCERKRISNIKFIDTDAREVVNTLPPASISVCHIYFPDPWFKQKHLRRRLVTPGLIQRIFQSLIPGGLLEIATDDADYFRQIKNELAPPGFRESVNERLFSPETKTLFETKYLAQGRNLYYLELIKTGD